MTLSPLALWTLENYLRRRIYPALPKYLELTERGIELRELPLKVRSPRVLGLVRAPRYRIHDPISGIELMRARLWIEPKNLPYAEAWMAPYRPVKVELDFESFVLENELKLLFKEQIAVLETNPKRASEMLRDRMARARAPINVWYKGDEVYFTYGDYDAWAINLKEGFVEVYFKRPESGYGSTVSDELLVWWRKDIVFGALYYSKIADTRSLRAEAKREYRRAGGVH
jgi:hypothetical protein